MKLILLLMALMPLVWANNEFSEITEVKQRSISSQIVDAIEAAKQQMPCGFPQLGVPPLVPLKTKHQEVNIDRKDFAAFGEVNDTEVYGLNDFDVLEFKVNAILSRVNFKFNWNHIYASGVYEVYTEKGKKGIKRTGPGKIAFKDLTIKGNIKYNLGLISGKLSLKELKVYVTLGEVKSEVEGLSKIKIINKKLNRLIEEWIMLAVNDNTNYVANMSNSLVLPIVNQILSDKTLTDLLGMLGGSGSNGEAVEKKPCIQSEYSSDYKKYFM